MNKPNYVYVTYILTTPERLWEALTNGDFTRQYFFGTRVSSDWKPGSSLLYSGDGGNPIVTGRIIRCERPRLLSFTWQVHWSEELQREPASRVTFEIEPMDKAVKLTVTHDDFPADSKVYPQIRDGWPGVISSLKSLLETGRPLPGVAG